MKAMILAAGKGTRVRPLTYDLPKPMIPILGKPVMAYLVEHLAKYGVTEIMVNVSYLHEKIEEYFGEGHQFGVHLLGLHHSTGGGRLERVFIAKLGQSPRGYCASSY